MWSWSLILKACLFLCVFLVGRQIGKLNSSTTKSCPTFPDVVFEPPILQLSKEELSKLPLCTGLKVHDHCSADDSAIITFMHLTPATIPTDIFSSLHHPSSPAKWSIILSNNENFGDVKAECDQLFLTRTGSRSNQPNKCVAVAMVPEGVASIVQNSHRKGFTALLTDQYQNDHARDYSIAEEKQLLPPLLQELASLLRDFKSKMGNPIAADGSRRSVIVMVANEGVMDLVLNFICSASSINIDLSSIAVFIGNSAYIPLIESMGARAFYSTALGSMPAHAAQGYLDKTFSRMMWFKTTSVFLALSAGFDVLFQDVDLVWLIDPVPYLRAQPGDISFMDDGARTPRYTPFFVNSGFFYVKHNNKTLYFEEKMMKCGPSEIGYTHSHQSVLIKHIAESHHLFGLQVNVLSSELFPSGQAYHENKKFIGKIIAKTVRPYVFHMCWTDNRVNKVVFFKEIGLWYLPDNKDTCTNSEQMLSYVDTILTPQKTTNIRDQCCMKEKYWPPYVPMA